MPELTFQGTPEWYGGGTGILKELIEKARKQSELPYEPYPGTRIAPFSPLQEESFNLAQRYAEPGPEYGEAYGNIQGALGRDIYGTEVQPYLQRGTTPPDIRDIEQFFNPYQQQVVENIGRLGSRNLTENILPGIQNKFISSGQYGSTGQQNLTNRAIRDTQEGISQAQGQALQGGYNTALQAALGQQERQLQAGQLAGLTAGKDVERQLLGSEALQNLSRSRQMHGLSGVGVLSQLGGQQQQQQQNSSNVAYQNFLNQQNFPYQQTARLSEISRGLPVNTQVYQGNVQPTPPPSPQSSPYTQVGGLLGGLTGSINQRQGYAHGGEVKKLSHHRHYADGGPLSPIQQGANSAIDTAELKAMRDQAQTLSRPQVDPFWASIARAGFNVAANRQPGVLAKLGEAGGAGLSEYQSQLGNQDTRGLQSAKIMGMIDTTRRLQAERNRQHELEKEKFGENKRQFGMTHGIHAGQLGLMREKFEHEKKLLSPELGLSPEYGKMKSKEEAKADVKRSEGIREKSNLAKEEIQSIDQMLGAINKAKLGPAFELRRWLGNVSQSLGINLPEELNIGDPAAMLEVTKGKIGLAMRTAKKLNPNKPTNFDLEIALKGLPEEINSPESFEQVMNTQKIFKLYEAEKDDFKNDWEEEYGSIRKKNPNGLTFEKAYDLYADENIWPELRALNKKYEVKK